MLTALILAAALNVQRSGGTPPPTCNDGDLFFQTSAVRGLYVCDDAAWTSVRGDESSSVPAGSILMVLSGQCPAGFAEESGLAGVTLVGTTSAAGNVGTSGGSDTITPAGTNASVNFTPAGSIAWPAGVPTFTGTPFSSVINHTHSVAVTDPGHTHPISSLTATAGAFTSYEHGTLDTSSIETNEGEVTASGTTGISATTANPSGGVASITPAGAVAWPAGVPVLTGTQGAVPAQTFTGSQFDNRSAFKRVIFCTKT